MNKENWKPHGYDVSNLSKLVYLIMQSLCIGPLVNSNHHVNNNDKFYFKSLNWVIQVPSSLRISMQWYIGDSFQLNTQLTQ